MLIFQNAFVASEILKERKDHKFRHYKDKKIAVLGPSINMPSTELYEEINTYDYTMIPNYNEKNIHFGKVNNKIIGIYTSKDYQENIKFGISSYHDLHEIILINHNPRPGTFKGKISSKKARFSLFYRDVLYYGIPNKIQILLMECLYNGALQIKLFNTNFMLEKKYIQNIDNYIIPYIRANYIHDLLSNYKLVKLMYSKKLIELDEITLGHTVYSDKDYIKLIERNLEK